MNNVQFATAIHILTMLAVTKDSLSSAYMAGSININPAMVRKSLSILAACGLVLTREGKGGGTSLGKPADKILLSEIYQAVNDSHLLGRFNSPNSECNTGKQINGNLQQLYHEADQTLITKLSKTTLADFCKKFK